MTTWAKVKQDWLLRHKRCHQEVLSCIIYTFHDYLHFQNFPHIEVKMADQAQKTEQGQHFWFLRPFSLVLGAGVCDPSHLELCSSCVRIYVATYVPILQKKSSGKTHLLITYVDKNGRILNYQQQCSLRSVGDQPNFTT